MKKRLCLFMTLLLLFMSVGCSQKLPQTPGTPDTETSKTDVGSIAAVVPSEVDNLNTDTSKPDNTEDVSLPGNTSADINDDNRSTSESDSSAPGNASEDINDDDHNASESDSSAPSSSSEVINDDEPNTSESDSSTLSEDGSYTSKEDVALYIHLYGHLPSNFITKKEAENLGWNGGSLEPFAPGKCIGGNHFGNYEGLLPQKAGRSYTECDIDTLGAARRGAKRIVFSNDGLIYYTEDHYNSFELLYGEANP